MQHRDGPVAVWVVVQGPGVDRASPRWHFQFQPLNVGAMSKEADSDIALRLRQVHERLEQLLLQPATEGFRPPPAART